METALRQSQELIRNSLERRSREVELSTQVAREIAAAPDLNELYKRVSLVRLKNSSVFITFNSCVTIPRSILSYLLQDMVKLA